MPDTFPTTFVRGDRARYTGAALSQYSSMPLCPGDEVAVSKPNDLDPEDDVHVLFRGTTYIVSAHDLTWLSGI